MAFEDTRPFVTIGGVNLKYSQPNISVDSSARFVSHKVIGDTTVRQKLGEDPREISIEGHCTKDEANDIDELIEESIVTMVSNRYTGQVQIASTSTSPFADGGGQDADQEWIHRFTIEVVEVAPGFGGQAGSGAPGP